MAEGALYDEPQLLGEVCMKEILVIIPAYNEAGSIERVVEGCRKKLPEADYLVVNDGSSDDTAKILRANGYRAAGQFRPRRGVSRGDALCRRKGLPRRGSV